VSSSMTTACQTRPLRDTAPHEREMPVQPADGVGARSCAGFGRAAAAPSNARLRFAKRRHIGSLRVFSRGTRLYWSIWPKLGVCHAIFKLRSLFSNRELHDCCDSTMAVSSHLGGFVMPFKGRTGSDGQNRVCVTLVSRDANFGQ